MSTSGPTTDPTSGQKNKPEVQRKRKYVRKTTGRGPGRPRKHPRQTQPEVTPEVQPEVQLEVQQPSTSGQSPIEIPLLSNIKQTDRDDTSDYGSAGSGITNQIQPEDEGKQPEVDFRFLTCI